MDEKVRIKSKNMTELSEYREHLIREPRLTYLFVELTDRCNLNCLHCGSGCDQSKSSYIDKGLLIKALSELADDYDPTKIMVCLTGGEPLLHPEFFEIAKAIVRLKFPWGITTNGTLIYEDTATKLKELCLKSVAVSIDGVEAAHDALRGSRGAFQRAVRGIDNLHAVGIPVQVTSVIHKGNFDSLEEIFGLMCELKTESWRVINLEPIGRALEHSDLLLSSEQFLKMLEFIREKRFSNATPMDVCFGCSHYLSYEYEHELRDNYFLCGAGIIVGSILSNGDIYACLDIERRSELIQGNISKDRFSVVWENGFKEFRHDRTLLSESCKNCAERAFCNGDSMHTWDFNNNEPIFCILRRDK